MPIAKDLFVCSVLFCFVVVVVFFFFTTVKLQMPDFLFADRNVEFY